VDCCGADFRVVNGDVLGMPGDAPCPACIVLVANFECDSTATIDAENHQKGVGHLVLSVGRGETPIG
jgi:hypothetical protein